MEFSVSKIPKIPKNTSFNSYFYAASDPPSAAYKIHPQPPKKEKAGMDERENVSSLNILKQLDI